MNKIHEKKPNQLVFDYKYSDIGILPTMKELTQDEIYKKYIRRSTTWYKYIQKGSKWELSGYVNMKLRPEYIVMCIIMVVISQKFIGKRKEVNNERIYNTIKYFILSMVTY